MAVAGDRGRPLPRGLRWSRWGAGDRPTLLAANGAGRANAAEAVRIACKTYAVSAVVSTGYAGALDPELRVGNILVANTVAAAGEHSSCQLEYAGKLPVCPRRPGHAVGVLLTIDYVAQDAETKRRLRLTGAAAVDMEASGVAAEALRQEIAFYCVRSISDEAGTSFPIDLNRARRDDGTFSGWRIVAAAAVRPTRWPELLRLSRDARAASRALAEFLSRTRFEI